MSNYTIPLFDDMEARVFIAAPHAWGANVSSHMFDADARIIADTSLTTYFDYCPAEIVYRELDRLLRDAQIPERDWADSLFDVLASVGLSCACE